MKARLRLCACASEALFFITWIWLAFWILTLTAEPWNWMRRIGWPQCVRLAAHFTSSDAKGGDAR